MRRKQPDTPQRRPEPRETDRSAQAAGGAFSPFAAAGERTAPGATPPGVGDSGRGRDTLSSTVANARSTGGGRYEFLAFRNWRVPTRLMAIMLIPVVIGLVFGGLRVNTSFDSYVKASHSERAAELARAATSLADALENERDLTLIPLMTGQDGQNEVARYRGLTDKAIKDYQAAYAKVAGDNDSEISRRDQAAESVLASLPHLRTNAYKPELYASATQAAYSAMISPLMAFDNSVGTGSSTGVARGRAIYAVSLAKASASTQRDLMLQLLVGISLNKTTRHENSELIQDLLVSAKLEQVSLTEFQNGSSPEDGRTYADQLVQQAQADTHVPQRMPDGQTIPTVAGLMNIALAYSEAAQAGQLFGKQAADQALENAQDAGLNPPNWLQATNSHLKPLRGTETILIDSVVNEAVATKDNAQTDAILNAAIVIAALALAGLLTGFIARSMILGMRTLNTAALEIANHRLPDLVEKLSKTDPDRVDTNVELIPLWGRDEIGEVARAFDQVHRQAVSLAAEQALLRGNLNAIFSNLSRRSQGLIQRQLALITDLENNEADPDQLENLFKLDHLATRMRRNGENLLVLAGEEPGRRWNTPVPLVDVLRAAASEVEQYERIELSGIPEAEVTGAAVTDLVHLLAELLENATSFSSPQTRVHVTATRLPDGRVLVEIHDKGIGLTAEDFAEINEKLAEPPTVDASISRRMGLFVVGRLSDRHDIRVQLRPSGESAGTTSLVMLPAAITQLRHAPEPEEQFTVSRIFAEQEAPAPGGWEQELYGTRSAAELGFDDNLAAAGGAAGGFSPALDSMQRSLRLEQRRRAALESGEDEAAEPLDPALPAQPSPSGYEPAAAEQPYQPQAYEQPYEGGYQAEEQAQEGYRADWAQPQYEQPGYQPAGGHPAEQTEYVEAEFVENEAYQGGYYGEQGYQEPYQQQQYQGGYYDQQQPYAESGYAEYEQSYQEPAAGHPYPEQQQPALPAAPAGSPNDTLGSGLPQRRPGQQLASGPGLGARAIGGLDTGEQPNWFTGAKDTSGSDPAARGHQVSQLGASGPTGPTGPAGAAAGPWPSRNDESWQRAEQVREPAAGGVTGAGLPRRVPKQNLVPGNAKPVATDGPQVSRNPEEVRGRLTNLRRGVEQGRNAGGDPGSTGSFRIDPQQNDSTDLFGGSNHQER
ncbi:nitrate- and nitrite sensing domain-containing protein [Streptomyces tateyamensis]|uniref:nitrate- and nitrite sensing domain-containing protein n=1 Tax=Streptomyces tateyamensis TaxID=565073 RepID=UPI001FE4F141|nr:nitrate- and nitrite sensing domain-containing protein [Streptomyces tateyamensis]